MRRIGNRSEGENSWRNLPSHERAWPVIMSVNSVNRTWTQLLQGFETHKSGNWQDHYSYCQWKLVELCAQVIGFFQASSRFDTSSHSIEIGWHRFDTPKVLALLSSFWFKTNTLGDYSVHSFCSFSTYTVNTLDDQLLPSIGIAIPASLPTCACLLYASSNCKSTHSTWVQKMGKTWKDMERTTTYMYIYI